VAMTPAQLATLKADILADSALNANPNNSDGNTVIRAAYALAASPEYLVWRTTVPQTEIMLNGFDWTRVDNLSVGKARIWEWMFDNPGKAIDPSKANIRAGINAVWVGTQADLDVRAAVYAHCHRACNRCERLFVTATAGGSGTRGSSANPDVAAFVGLPTINEIETARNLP
jgi:hypothetical protein